jgi:hypothetical protein
VQLSQAGNEVIANYNKNNATVEKPHICLNDFNVLEEILSKDFLLDELAGLDFALAALTSSLFKE